MATNSSTTVRNKLDADYYDDPYIFECWKMYGSIGNVHDPVALFDKFFAVHFDDDHCLQHGDICNEKDIFMFCVLLQNADEHDKFKLYNVFINIERFLELVSNDKTTIGN
jgi:hypothetical protein